MRRSDIAVLIVSLILAAAPCAGPAAAQGVSDDYVPAPAFGGAPSATRFTQPPALTNREEVARILAVSYPASLRQMQIGGEVLMWILVGERGEVKSARVHGPSGHPVLDAAALQVVARMRFAPGRVNDRPTSGWIRLPVIFRTMGFFDPLPATTIPLQPGRPNPNRLQPHMPGAVRLPEPGGTPSLLNRDFVLATLAQRFRERFPDGSGRGTTKVRLHVDNAGNAMSAEVTASSGSPALDSLALSLKDVLVFVPAIRSDRYAEGTAELSFRFPPKEEK